MRSLAGRRIGRNPSVNARRGTNGTGSEGFLARCPFCLKGFSPDRRSQRWCSTRCRQMSYWLAQIQKALHDGRADGIRPRLEELRRFDHE